MPNVRPMNEKKYGISKNAFRTTYSYCLMYEEWKEKLMLEEQVLRSPQLTGLPGAGETSDQTADAAIDRVDLENKITRIEETVKAAVDGDMSLYPFLLEYVTKEGVTYYSLMCKGIPCGSRKLYDLRRRFYYLMSKKIL